MLTRVTIRADQMGGAPCIRGLRIPVSVVVDMIAEGLSPKEILEHHPDLQAEDIPEALRFAAEAIRELGHIDLSTPRPVVSGTDIKVSLIASEVEQLGMTPDEVIDAHPHLRLAEVHAALAYYFDHQDVIRAEWLEAQTLVDDVRHRYPGRSSGKPR